MASCLFCCIYGSTYVWMQHHDARDCATAGNMQHMSVLQPFRCHRMYICVPCVNTTQCGRGCSQYLEWSLAPIKPDSPDHTVWPVMHVRGMSMEAMRVSSWKQPLLAACLKLYCGVCIQCSRGAHCQQCFSSVWQPVLYCLNPDCRDQGLGLCQQQQLLQSLSVT